MRIDVHQHIWTEPLVEELSARRQFPFIRHENGLAVLYLADERPYVIDLPSESPSRRTALVERDGLDGALICLSSPLGIESLPREQALPLLDAYHAGAVALGEPFGVWGALALDRPDPDEVDLALGRGCVGIALPAGAIASVRDLAGMREVLDRVQELGAPLLVHPGPGTRRLSDQPVRGICLEEPLWWPALTCYVSSMQAAWLAFNSAGRASHPGLRVIFTMLAGLAPLHAERLSSRGGPGYRAPDPLVFYDTSSYGPAAVAALEGFAGSQLLYGSDRPVVDPAELGMPDKLDWDRIHAVTERVLRSDRLTVAE
jgi:hypothetical protein